MLLQYIDAYSMLIPCVHLTPAFAVWVKWRLFCVFLQNRWQFTQIRQDALVMSVYTKRRIYIALEYLDQTGRHNLVSLIH